MNNATPCTSNLRSYGRFPQVLWRLMLIWLKISFLLPVLQSWFRDLAEASIRLSTRIPKFWGALECSFALNVLPLDAQSSVSLILRRWLRWKTLYIPGSSGPFSTSSSTTLSAYSLIWFLFCQLVKGVIFCPSCIHEEPLKFQSCPGKFVIKRAAGDRLVRLLVEMPCSDHILPPRIRQTTAEKEHHAAVVKAHGRVPISQRDPAGMVNSELHRKRTYRIRSTLKSSGLDKLDELSCLGEYTSTPDYSRLLIKAPYESTFQKRGNTFFIDSTYKVVGPAKDDMRKGPQLIVLSSYSLILAKHIVLRGMFTKPATRAEYRVFFKSVFSTYGLPSTNPISDLLGILQQLSCKVMSSSLPWPNRRRTILVMRKKRSYQMRLWYSQHSNFGGVVSFTMRKPWLISPILSTMIVFTKKSVTSWIPWGPKLGWKYTLRKIYNS